MPSTPLFGNENRQPAAAQRQKVTSNAERLHPTPKSSKGRHIQRQKDIQRQKVKTNFLAMDVNIQRQKGIHRRKGIQRQEGIRILKRL